MPSLFGRRHTKKQHRKINVVLLVTYFLWQSYCLCPCARYFVYRCFYTCICTGFCTCNLFLHLHYITEFLNPNTLWHFFWKFLKNFFWHKTNMQKEILTACPCKPQDDRLGRVCLKRPSSIRHLKERSDVRVSFYAFPLGGRGTACGGWGATYR